MKQDLGPALTHLGRDQLLRVRNLRGGSLVIFDGMVWVTQEGDPRDRLLASGESFTFDRGGVALIHALEPTRFVLLDADAAVTVADDGAVIAAPAPWKTRQHVLRRAARLRRLAFASTWRYTVAIARRAWTWLTGALSARAVPRGM
jgi:hypothetical protein